jgi:hypothetical protein
MPLARSRCEPAQDINNVAPEQIPVGNSREVALTDKWSAAEYCKQVWRYRYNLRIPAGAIPWLRGNRERLK